MRNRDREGQPREGEVPSSLRGRLGNLTFRRAWYYWVVSGNVPLRLAEELYADAVGKTDIRVAGHCGCPAPKEWAKWLDPKTGKRLVPVSEWEKLKEYSEKGTISEDSINAYQSSEDPTTGDGYIDNYHIDTELGLRIFADMIKKNGLAT